MVAQRIQDVMRHDPEAAHLLQHRRLYLSRRQQGRIEKLLSDADQNLYAQKSSRKRQAAATAAR